MVRRRCQGCVQAKADAEVLFIPCWPCFGIGVYMRIAIFGLRWTCRLEGPMQKIFNVHGIAIHPDSRLHPQGKKTQGDCVAARDSNSQWSQLIDGDYPEFTRGAIRPDKVSSLAATRSADESSLRCVL